MVQITDIELRRAAAGGMDAFIKLFADAILGSVGGTLTEETMSGLNAAQLTLVGYYQLREEVMDGGFVQLIHNGWGEFVFLNPVAKVLRVWGLTDLSKLLYDAGRLYRLHRDEIERPLTDEEFMALFEQMPDFDDLDDRFVEAEEEYTEAVARYIDGHINQFCEITDKQ